MKFKATKKEMKQNYTKIIGIGYCNAQFLLHYKNSIAYSTRAEGWACDYYDIDGVLISTGYSYLDNKNTYADYEIIKEYNNKAEKIRYSNQNCDMKKTQVTALLKEFIKNAKTNK